MSHILFFKKKIKIELIWSKGCDITSYFTSFTSSSLIILFIFTYNPSERNIVLFTNLRKKRYYPVLPLQMISH